MGGPKSMSTRIWCIAAAVVAAVRCPAAEAPMPMPGMVNVVEGRVILNGQAIQSASGPESAEPGQVLETQQGKAELLLTPGVFLRLLDNSAVKLVSRSADEAQVEVMRGTVLVDADGVRKVGRLDVIEGGADIRLLAAGTYEFHAADAAVQVFHGKVSVRDARGGGPEVARKELKIERVKAGDLDVHGADALYEWSLERSDDMNYVRELMADAMGGTNPDGNHASGWHWSPWYNEWVYIPTSMLP
jgi:hypothetical protein